MSEAKIQFDNGNLNEAINAALEDVRNNPTDVKARTFLFELALFAGDWERAGRQLDVIGQQDAESHIGAQIYRQNLECEKTRANVFDKGATPEFIGAPTSSCLARSEAVRLIHKGDADRARKMIDENADAPVSAIINGEKCEDFRDYDDLTADFFEAFVKGQYVWLPFSQIKRLQFLPVKTLRDICWRHAEIETRNGIEGEVFLPAIYFGTWRENDDALRLGRASDWQDAGAEIFRGKGQRVFAVGEKNVPFSALETIEFDAPDESAE